MKKKNFFEPAGYVGYLWRTAIYLAGFVLLCFLYTLLPSKVYPWANGVVITPINDSAYNNTHIPAVIEEAIDSTCYDLVKYCPIPGDQGEWGTCTAWACSYAARTICEAVDSNWTNTQKITSEVFSPWYIFTQINHNMDCERGSFPGDALDTMKSNGVCKKSVYDVVCNSAVPPEILPYGAKYKIDDYFRLFECSSYERGDAQEDSLRLVRIKRAIINNRPVIIASKTYNSFHHPTDVWDGDTRGNYGLHAMCVVGFCDDKYNGAFLIQNSWGTQWGDGGRIWVKYDDFLTITGYAWEMYMKPHYPDSLNHFEGAFTLLKESGEPIEMSLDETQAVKCYTPTSPIGEDTKFRCKLENKEPAYVYMIGGNSNNADLYFPYDQNTSPALVYRPNNTVNIPKDKDDYFMVGNAQNDNYFCLLFSPDAIDLNKLAEDYNNATGDFMTKVTKALSTRIVAGYDIEYSNDKIAFKSKTRGEIVAIFVKLN